MFAIQIILSVSHPYSVKWTAQNSLVDKSVPGCSKLTTSLGNVLLKFQMLISEIRHYFSLKNVRNFSIAKASFIFSTKNFSVFG